MPRRSILSAAERDSLLAIPTDMDDLIRRYAFDDDDLKAIRQHRGAHNQLGFAIQLCYMRQPGTALGPEDVPPFALINVVVNQLELPDVRWEDYGRREETRREHLLELQARLGVRPFTMADYRNAVAMLTDVALQTDKGVVLARTLIEDLRRRAILLPATNTIDRACAEAVVRANARIYATLADALSNEHRQRLDELLAHEEGSATTRLGWLRQAPLKPSGRQMLEHIRRLTAWRALGLREGIERSVHQNRLLKLARVGAQMTPAAIARLEPQRRYATLVAGALESTATVTDEVIELNDRIVGKIFNDAKRKQAQNFQSSMKDYGSIVKWCTRVGSAVREAREHGGDALASIQAAISWGDFDAVLDTAYGLEKHGGTDDYLPRIVDKYTTVRRYAREFLDVLDLHAAPAAGPLLAAIETLRTLNASGARAVPPDAPTAFVKPRWSKLVFAEDGSMDRRYYELCAMSELRNTLRSGDMWVRGSRQFKDFDEYLMPAATFAALHADRKLPLSVETDCDTYLRDRIQLLEDKLDTAERLAAAGDLGDAVITAESGLKLSHLDPTVPDAAEALIDQTASLLPHLKITDLLLEVDAWTGFTRHFTHLKTGDPAKDTSLLLTAILADGINLGLDKMAESCPGTTYAKLAWLQTWHVRDETYSAALAELVNAQYRQPFATHWGEGTTSSSDGQRFRAGNHAEGTGHVNPKYGSEPGRLFYTHISDQYAPFSSKVINVGVRDSTYVLDGLLYHESDLRIQEHYTDTAGFTDHVFALMHLLGFRFAPRIRDLAETKLYVPKGTGYSTLKPMIGGMLRIDHVRTQWDELLRLAASIQTGTVTASLMLRKLGSYPRQNGLALALRELGRIERTLFILDYLMDIDLRHRIQAGLNKGESRNALSRAVFSNRAGEIRDRTIEQQRYRASGLNLLTAAIVLWNTVYLDRAVVALQDRQEPTDEALFQYLSPLGWGHIALTGDYFWRSQFKVGQGNFRPLRKMETA